MCPKKCPLAHQTRPMPTSISILRLLHDTPQVIRAASPVLLRIIILGAFFIYSTVTVIIIIISIHYCMKTVAAPAEACC